MTSRKTPFRVKFMDRAAGVFITVGGVSVILAVMGLIAFVVKEVAPLFGSASHDVAVEAIQQEADQPLCIHADEYRRVGVRFDADGTVEVFSVSDGETIKRSKPEILGDAGFREVQISLRPRGKGDVADEMDVPLYHVAGVTTDNRIVLGTLAYVATFERYALGEDPPAYEKLYMPTDDEFKEYSYVPETLVDDGHLVEHLNQFGFYRKIQCVLTLDRELDLPPFDGDIVAFASQADDLKASEDREFTTVFATSTGGLWLVEETSSFNMMMEETDYESESYDISEHAVKTPAFVLVNELRSDIVVASRDGWVARMIRTDSGVVDPDPQVNVFGSQADVKNARAWSEIVNDDRENTADGDLKLTAMTYLLGNVSIVFGDSWGGLQSWFPVSESDEGRKYLARIHTFDPLDDAVTDIVASPYNKTFLAASDTRIVATNNTAEREFAEFDIDTPRATWASPKGDGLLSINAKGELNHWWIDAPHSEISLRVLFGKVWYEDYAEPEYEWQSSGGTSDVEPKISLVPLIAGTFKGGLYALLFAVPLAILAAIFTSEFMHPRLKSILKPTMEVMASLPSVVLGFLAALVFAPAAATNMPMLLVMLLVVPMVFLGFGRIWARMPASFTGKVGPWRGTAILLLLFGLAIALSSWIGPRFEGVVFPASEGANPNLIDSTTFEPVSEDAANALSAGSFRSWTDGGRLLPRESTFGETVLPKGWWIPGGHNLLWMLVALPCILLAMILQGFICRKVYKGAPAIRDRVRHALGFDTPHAIGADVVMTIGNGLLLIAVGLLLAWPLAWGMEHLFFSYDHPTAGQVADFRRALTGDEGWKFENLNSMIVGFAMGFAVIPIIYTISEDALTSVPNQLRAASLACGASRWQTTTRVVLPAATSGIFSAIVIGLGRALGETMIVVMAAGGTPVMDFQPLSGFRSLSAAIAIEMPEAPKEGTLYRTLFLAGLLLLALTFVINTFAELVRIRLRRKLSRI